MWPLKLFKFKIYVYILCVRWIRLKKIKIDVYSELEKIKEFKENEFIIDLKDCSMKQRERIVDFLSGLVFLKGSIKKLNNNEFEVKIVK